MTRDQIKKITPKPSQQIIPKTQIPPKPKPTPKPPETPPKKQITKPTPAPPKQEPPKKKIAKPESTPKPAQKPPEPTPEHKPEPTPAPRIPPPSRNTPVPPPINPRAPSSHAPTGPASPAVPMSNKPPLEIVQEDLPDYYLLLATQKIESNFKLARAQRYAGVICVVEFLVNKNGEISGAKVLKTTGQPALDQYAIDAVQKTETLGPLPDSIKESSITITATFEYSPDSE